MHLPCPPEKSDCIHIWAFYHTSLKSECTLCLQTPALFSQTPRTLRHHSSLSLYPKKGSSTLKPFMYIKYSFKKPKNEDFIAQQTTSSTVFGTLIMEILSFCLTFIFFAVMRVCSLSWGFYWNLCQVMLTWPVEPSWQFFHLWHVKQRSSRISCGTGKLLLVKQCLFIFFLLGNTVQS